MTTTDAAKRLRRLVGLFLTVASVVFGIAVAVGGAVAVMASDTTARLTGVAVAGGAVMAWLGTAVFCAAAQAFACYLEEKVSSRAG